MGETKYCGKCGAKNDSDSKFCGKCGESLDTISSSTISPKPKPKITDRLSKYRTKRNYGIIIAAILSIAIISVLFSWLPGIVFAKHYDDGYVSFDYPYNANVSEGVTMYKFADLINSGDYDGNFASISSYGYEILIGVAPINSTESVPINQTINQTVGLSGNGSPIVAPVNVTTPDSKKENVNVLQETLNRYISSGGSVKNSTKNGFTYYDLGTGTEGSLAEGSLGGPFTFNQNLVGNNYATLIVKNGLPYFFVVELRLDDRQTHDNGYNAYQQIVNTFKLG